MSFRRINKIDLGNLKNDILNSDLKTKPGKELPKLSKQYDTILQTNLNKHPPLHTNCFGKTPYPLDDTGNLKSKSSTTSLGKSLAQKPFHARQITLQSSVESVQ